ncbi:MAG: CPBP family intramembrane metalloprotease [Muricomes sp.]
MSAARKNAIMTCVVYGGLISIVYGMGYLRNVRIVLSTWMIIGAVTGILIIFVELGMAQLKAKKEFGSFTRIIKPPKSYVEAFHIVNVILIILAAGFEEMLFRQILIRELYLGLNDYGLYIGIVMSSLLYAINHIYFSTFAVMQKLVSGLVFSMLFVFSGFNLGIPIIAHCVQNVTLYLFGAYTHGKESKK